MKKVMTLATIVALSLSTVAEAKRGGSFGASRSTPVVQKKTNQSQSQTQQKQADADFNNTPPKQAQAAAAQPSNNRMTGFATGALAGYLLSDALSPSEAHANTQNPAVAAEPMQQLNEQVQQAQPTVPAFKAIDPQDPFLIEKTQGYLRYCLNGVQYLISTANTQLPPTLMVDRNNAPAQCAIVQ